jgi:hypothetical protein
MKEPKLPPGYPPCSEAGAKLRSPVSAFFGKIAGGHPAGSATGILLGNPCLRLRPEDHDPVSRGLKVVALDSVLGLLGDLETGRLQQLRPQLLKS